MKLPSEMMVEILSRTSLKTFDTMRCTSKEFDKLTYDRYILDLYKQRNNIVCGILVQNMKKGIKKLIPFNNPNNLDLAFLPSNARIVATSEQGIIVFEHSEFENSCWKHVYHVCKPTTKQVLELPNLKTMHWTDKAAIVVLGSNPLRYKIVRWSKHETKSLSNYVATKCEESHYVTYYCDIFDSMTWEWRQLGILPFSFMLSFLQPITTRGSIYMLLTDNKVLKFDAYLELWTTFLLPVPTRNNHLYKFIKQLVKYQGKLGFLCKRTNGYREMWVHTTDESWEKTYINREVHGSHKGNKNDRNIIALYALESDNDTHYDYQWFLFRSDFETVDFADKKCSTITDTITYLSDGYTYFIHSLTVCMGNGGDFDF